MEKSESSNFSKSDIWAVPASKKANPSLPIAWEKIQLNLRNAYFGFW